MQNEQAFDSQCGTTGRESLGTRCRTFSIATGRTVQRHTREPDLAWRSRKGSLKRTADVYGWKASLATAALSASGCRFLRNASATRRTLRSAAESSRPRPWESDG